MPERDVDHADVPEFYQFQLSLTDHPVICDEAGVYRYKVNKLARWLADKVGLNDMWVAYFGGRFTQEEFMQFYRDIGYSLGGFEEIWAETLDKMERKAMKGETC